MIEFEDDVEELLGGGPDRATKRIADRTERHIQEAIRRQQMNSGAAAENVLDGVSVPWLARVFGLDPVTVRKRLVGCPKMKVMTSGHLYDVAEAAKYLVTPRLDHKAFLKALKANELPPAMQDAYWSAIIKRQKAEIESGELWPTDDVYELLTGVFKTIRETLQLFPDTLDQQAALSAEQRAIIVKMLDGLQNDIHQGLQSYAREHETFPVRARVIREAEETM